jgi:hypothetical protein
MSTPTSATEYLTTLRDGWSQAMQQWVDQSGSAWDQWSRWAQDWAGAVPQPPGWGPGAAPRGKPGRPGHDQHHHHDHDHRGHRRDDCDGDCGCDCGCGRGHEARDGCRDACGCCVPEADVVVHARAGEVRVVPFRLSNRWRREREVTLAIGPWQVCGGRGLEVRGILEDEKLVLAPCEDRVVRLIVSVGGRDTTNTDTTNTDGTSDQAGDNNEAPAADVDESVSAYADVRFEGCGRPVRVAVVVSPARCDAVDVCCDCGCCC